MKFSFRGNTYKILQKKLKGLWGNTDSPNTPNAKMRFNPDQDGKQLLNTLIHEPLHACLWDLDEDAVRETADDISAFLWKMGYRRTGE
jgi:hypothetical protein